MIVNVVYLVKVNKNDVKLLNKESKIDHYVFMD